MSQETVDDHSNGELVVAGLQGAGAFVTGYFWIEGVVPIFIPVLFALSAITLFVVSTLKWEDVYEEKSRVSETPDEDPRQEMEADEDGDASVRPGKSVSQDDLQAIAGEHDDVTVLGVDQATGDEAEVDKSGEIRNE